MKKTILFLFVLAFSRQSMSQKTLNEKLGYAATNKLLIIHADDLGVSHSENSATIRAMEAGSVNSASIMVPCPWYSGIAAYVREHPHADFGLHLTLTSEWKYYKWPGLTGETGTPGLHAESGYLFAGVDSVYAHASLEEVEKELRSQIDRAVRDGLDITHLDSHMAALFGRPDYLRLLIRLGREYRVPVLLTKAGVRSALAQSVDDFLIESDVLLDAIYTATPDDYKKGMQQFYTRVLRELKPGVSELIIHTAYDDAEMRAITMEHDGWHAPWRQQDYDFFTSDACKKLLAEHNIQLVTWREIRDRVTRR